MALVAANLLPLLGVVFLDWDLQMVLMLYWAESGIIGFYTMLKMLRIFGPSAIGLCLFFTVHYGIFMTVHGMFLLALTEMGSSGFGDAGGAGMLPDSQLLAEATSWPILLSLTALFISHGVSFVRHVVFMPPQDRPAEPGHVMMEPYGRIVIMHLAIIFGTFAVIVLKAGIAVLVLLIVLKIAVDVWAHLRVHSKHLDRPSIFELMSMANDAAQRKATPAVDEPPVDEPGDTGQQPD